MRSNRSHTLWLLLLAVVLLLIGGGYWWWSSSASDGTTTPPTPAPSPADPDEVVGGIGLPTSPAPTVVGTYPPTTPPVEPPTPPIAPPVEPPVENPVWPPVEPPAPWPTPDGGVVVVPEPPAPTGGEGLRVGYASDLGLLDLYVASLADGRVQLANRAGMGGAHYLINRQRPWVDSLDGLRFSTGRVYTIQAVVPDGGPDTHWLRPGVRFAQTTFTISS